MRLAALAPTFVAWFSFALAAQAAPLTRADLVALAASGLSEKAIERLVEADGLAPLGAADALALREAGLSADFVSWLVTWTADDAIRVEERDGVIVVSGEGPPSEEPAPPDHGSEPPEDAGWPWAADEPAPVAAAPQVVVLPMPLAPAEPESAPGYPVGATFGWSGGAVFLPSRFGGSEPSAFGRTIVGFGAPALPVGCVAPGSLPVPAYVAPAPERRRIPVETSRGTLWIPN